MTRPLVGAEPKADTTLSTPLLARSRLTTLAIALAACRVGGGDKDTSAPAVQACPPDSWVRWDNFAEPMISTWCTPCHSAYLPEELRQGAPVGVDFDTYDQVVAQADRIVYRTTTVGDMPPVPGPTDADRALLAEWVACGEPVPPPPTIPGPCDVLTTVSGDSDGSDLCAQGNALDGTLTIAGDVDLSCLCQVTGDVIVDVGATTVEAPLLSSIGGSLRIVQESGAQSVSFPAVVSVGGSVHALTVPTLETLDLSQLFTVGDDVTLTSDDALVDLRIARLSSVGTALDLEHDKSLATLDIAYLMTVGTDLVLTDLPALASLPNTATLATVGGDITITKDDSLTALDSFPSLLTVGGTIEVASNQAMTEIAGFDEVTSVGGDVLFTQDAAVTLVDALISVESIGGTYEVSNNPQLTTLAFLPLLTTAGGVVVTDNPLLNHWDPALTLVSVAGDLDVSRNPALPNLGGFADLSSIGGDLRFDDDTSLTDVYGLGPLASVGGTVSFSRDPVLANVDALEDLATAGAVVLEDLPLLTLLPDLKVLVGTGDLTFRRTGLVGPYVLSDLAQLNGSLVIDSNTALTTITGLYGINLVVGDVTIVDNPVLPTAEVTALVDGIPAIGGAVTVSGNGP